MIYAHSIFAAIIVPAYTAGTFCHLLRFTIGNIMGPLSKNLVLAFTGFCIFGIASAHPLAAQDLVYTLSDVSFNDGAVASGFFEFNPATKTFGSYDITTTDGVTDSLVGAHYLPGGYSPTSITPGLYDVFNFVSNDGKYNFLSLVTNLNVLAESPGLYTIETGVSDTNSFGGSGEFAPITNSGSDNRVVEMGSFLVTEKTAPVPEASTTVSFGLLLALGFGGVVFAARKKKAVIQV